MPGNTETMGYVGVSGGWRTPADAGSQIRSVREQFQNVDPDTKPFVTRAGGWDQFTVDENYKIEWVEDDLFKPELTLGAALGTGDTAITWDNPDSYRMAIGDSLQIENEKLLVTAAAPTSSTTTVIRGAFGTTVAAHANGKKVQVLASARPEGSDSPFTARPIKTFYFNYFQFLDEGWQISEQYNNLRSYGDRGIKKMAQERARVTLKLAVGAEYAAIHGTRFIGVDPQPSTFGGAISFINTAAGSYRKDMDGASIVEANLYTGIRFIGGNVDMSNVARTFVTRFWQKQKITAMFQDRVRTEIGTHTGGLRIDNVETDFGNFEVISMISWPEDKIGLIDFDRIELGHWAGLGWSEKRLAEKGRYMNYTRSAVLSEIFRNPQVHGLWDNLSTSA